MTTTTEDHLDDASTVAILGSRANNNLASSSLIALFGGTGLLLSTNPVQRLMFFGCLVASILAMQWGTRLMSAVWREDNHAAIGWEKLLTRIWQVQLFCLLSAGLSLVVGGLALPNLHSEAKSLTNAPFSMKELKKHEQVRPIVRVPPATLDRPGQGGSGLA